MRIIIFIFLLPLVAKSQAHHEFWSKINITKRINNHWDVGLDLQFRQQSNFKTERKDIFQYPMTRSIRSWAYYHLKNKWTIVASPIAYFVSDEIKNNLGDLKKIEDLRFMVGIMKTIQFPILKFNNRFLVEYRIIEIDQPEHFYQWRYRLQNAFTIPLHAFKRKTELNYIIGNEFFLKSQSHQIFFDQERLLNLVQWKQKHFDIDLGYQWTIQKGNNSTQYRNQWLISTNIII